VTYFVTSSLVVFEAAIR